MQPTIQQLQSAYRAINGIDASDIHRLRASHHFNVEYVSVTDEQYVVGQQLNFSGKVWAPTVTVGKVRRVRIYKPAQGAVCYR